MPAEQAWQDASDFAATALENLPALQVVQDVAWSEFEYVPALQSEHSKRERKNLALPDAHAVQFGLAWSGSLIVDS